MTSGLATCPCEPHRVLEAASAVAAEAAARAADLDHDGAYPREDIDRIHTSGLLLAPFPTALGGADLAGRADDLRDVLITLGRGSLPLARLYEGHVNAVALAVRYGSPANVRLLRQEAVAGRPSAVWMAGEPLRFDEDAARPTLIGHKILCSGAGYVARPLVAADTAAGSLMLIPRVVEPSRADSTRWTSHGMRATATGTVAFTGIAVEDDEIVGEPGDYLRSPYFRGGAWRVIAAQLGGLEAILAQYREQLAGGRHRDHPIQLARFGEAAIACETARLWVRQACAVAEGSADGADTIDAYVDFARNAFEDAALRLVSLAEKAIGLNAFLRPNPMERIIRDLRTYLRQPALDQSLLSGAAHLLASGPWPDRGR